MKRRVVVTGLGAVTPIGNTVPEFWQGIREGRVGIGEITRFDTESFKVKLAAEVRNFDAAERMDPKAAKRMERFSQYAVAAAKEAFADADLHLEEEDPFRAGVIVGSGYHVNPKSLGYRTCTYVGIKLEKGSMYKTVVAELGKIPEIVECHFTTGPYTMLTKVYARDNEHLMDLLNNKMQEIPGVTATETLISLEQSIKKEIPICPEK